MRTILHNRKHDGEKAKNNDHKAEKVGAQDMLYVIFVFQSRSPLIINEKTARKASLQFLCIIVTRLRVSEQPFFHNS